MKSLKLATRQSLALDNPPCAIRDGNLEHVLCQIHCDRHSIHLGLLLVAWCHPRFTAMMPRENREESMPSRERSNRRWR